MTGPDLFPALKGIAGPTLRAMLARAEVDRRLETLRSRLETLRSALSYDPECCHKTRLLGAPCPVGCECPYDAPKKCCLDGVTDMHPFDYAGGACQGCPREDPKSAHPPIRTPVEPTPDVFLHAWKT